MITCGDEFLMLIDTSFGDTHTFTLTLTHTHTHIHTHTHSLPHTHGTPFFSHPMAAAVPAAARSGGAAVAVRGRCRLRCRLQQRRGEAGERSGGGGSDR